MNAEFSNIKHERNILAHNRVHCVKTMKSKFYYNILVKAKFVKNYMQSRWEREFDIQVNQWEGIYLQNVWETKDRKLGEFRYKLLANIICTCSIIQKWNPSISKHCEV